MVMLLRMLRFGVLLRMFLKVRKSSCWVGLFIRICWVGICSIWLMRSFVFVWLLMRFSFIIVMIFWCFGIVFVLRVLLILLLCLGRVKMWLFLFLSVRYVFLMFDF